MAKQNLYVALLNAAIGLAISWLLKGNLLVYALAFVAIFTILLIERRRIFARVFGGKFWWAVMGYTAVVVAMIGAFAFVHRANRDKSLIIQATQDFVGHLKPGEYAQAYALLSDISKKSYSQAAFVKDNQRLSVMVNDFRIDGIEFNEIDKKKAVVKVSSPFLIYGQNSIALDLVKEPTGWRLVCSPSIVQGKTLQANQSSTGVPHSGSRHRPAGGGSGGGMGKIGGVLRSLF